MTGKASTPEEYLAQLPPERRSVAAAVRKMILEHLPDGYEESMSWGMITYEIPLERYPDTYNGKPLGYAALAAQKNHFSLYLMGAYQDPAQAKRIERAFEHAGMKLDMGKSCVRFRKLDDLPLEALGEVIASMPPDVLIRNYEESRRR